MTYEKVQLNFGNVAQPVDLGHRMSLLSWKRFTISQINSRKSGIKVNNYNYKTSGLGRHTCLQILSWRSQFVLR